MPDAANSKYDEGVYRPAGNTHAVASQGNVKVVAKPGGQGDVLPAPEFLDGVGKIWRFEIVDQGETHRQSTA